MTSSSIQRGQFTSARFTNGLSIPTHDYISNTYTDGNLTTVVYKRGGASGTTVATLTMTYDLGNNLLTVTRT